MRRSGPDPRTTALAAAALAAAVLAALSARPLPPLRGGPAPLPRRRASPAAEPVPGAASLRDAVASAPSALGARGGRPMEKAADRKGGRRLNALAGAASDAATASRAGAGPARSPSAVLSDAARPATRPGPDTAASPNAAAPSAPRPRPSRDAAAKGASGAASTDRPSAASASRRAPRSEAALPRLAPFARERRSAAGAGKTPDRRRRPAPASAAPARRPTRAAARPSAPRAAGRARRFRPPSWGSLLGRRALRPPPKSWQAPAALAALDAPGPAALGLVESLDPAHAGRDRRAAPHWDGPYWHQGPARRLERDGARAWLYRDGERWWARTGGAVLARHDGLWWTRVNGVWLVVHDGEPWAWRSFHDWDAAGLYHPGTGTEMVYSRDLARVAVVTPGRGAVVYDAASGTEVGEVPESRMPARRRPRLPSRLTLPDDVFSH